MDRMMLRQAIQKIEQEREVHDQKFGNNPVHKECLPRFEKVLDNLRSDLEKAESDSAANP
jgi:hypothetical protein